MWKSKLLVVTILLFILGSGCAPTPDSNTPAANITAENSDSNIPEANVTAEVFDSNIEANNESDCPYLLPFSSAEGEVTITQGNFGAVSHFPTTKDNPVDLSYAVDFSLPGGTPILATREGIVSKVNKGGGGCGGPDMVKEWLYVIIDHQDGTFSVYAHLQKILVEEEQLVFQGDPIGLSGNSGYTDCSNHLHYQLQSKGTNVSNSIELCFSEINKIPEGKETLTVNSNNSSTRVVSSMELSKDDPYNCGLLTLTPEEIANCGERTYNVSCTLEILGSIPPGRSCECSPENWHETVVNDFSHSQDGYDFWGATVLYKKIGENTYEKPLGTEYGSVWTITFLSDGFYMTQTSFHPEEYTCIFKLDAKIID